MNFQVIQQYWKNEGEPLYTYPPSAIEQYNIDEDTFLFLVTCGFPDGAAPFLSFTEVKEGQLLTPNQVFSIDVEELDEYLMIGSNSSGDPICIDRVGGYEIVYLNHDNYFERIFINEDIFKFACCLTKYKDFINSIISDKPDDYTRRKFSDGEFEELKTKFTDIDKSCLKDNTFWAGELNYLLWERNNE